VQSRPRGERGDGDLALGGDERLEEIERPVHRLDRPTCPLCRSRRFFHRAEPPICVVEAYLPNA
jgi:hypothetical protein